MNARQGTGRELGSVAGEREDKRETLVGDRGYCLWEDEPFDG